MEQNKIRTYLFYAIGEIFLVVIGILIALQVNNWNEERKEFNLRDELISDYASDLRNNVSYLEARKSLINEDLQTISDYIDRLQKNPFKLDTLKKIALTEFSPNYYAFTELKNDTYTSLVSNNQLRIMPDELSESMIEINFLMTDLIVTQNKVIEFYRTALTDYVSNYVSGYETSIYSRDETDKLWKKMDKDQWKLAFNGVILAKQAGYYSVIPRSDSLLVKVDSLLKVIDKNYP